MSSRKPSESARRVKASLSSELESGGSSLSETRPPTEYSPVSVKTLSDPEVQEAAELLRAYQQPEPTLRERIRLLIKEIYGEIQLEKLARTGELIGKFALGTDEKTRASGTAGTEAQGEEAEAEAEAETPQAVGPTGAKEAGDENPS